MSVNNSNKTELSLTLKGVKGSLDTEAGFSVEEVSASWKTDVTDSSLQNWQGKVLGLVGLPLKGFLEGLFQQALEDMAPNKGDSRQDWSDPKSPSGN